MTLTVKLMVVILKFRQKQQICNMPITYNRELKIQTEAKRKISKIG